MNREKMVRNLRYAYFMTACVQACYYPFFIVFLKSRRLDYVQIGICFALAALVGAMSQPVWGYVADKYWSKRRVLLVLIAGCDVATLLILVSHTFLPILLTTVMLSLFMPSVTTVLDSLCMGISLESCGIDFNRMRMMNSIGWAFCAAAAGVVVNGTAAVVSLLLLAVFNTISFFPVNAITIDTKRQNQPVSKKCISELLRRRRFFVFLLSTLFLNITMSTHGNYLAVLIKSTGGNTSIVGMVFGLLSLCEIPTFFYGRQLLARFSSLRLYRVSILCYGLRFLLESFCTTWQLVVLVQVLQFASYALYYVSALNYLGEIVEGGMLTTCFTLHAAVGSGIGGFVGNLLGGYVLQSSSMQILLRLLVGITLVSWIIAAFIGKRNNEEKAQIEFPMD